MRHILTQLNFNKYKLCTKLTLEIIIENIFEESHFQINMTPSKSSISLCLSYFLLLEVPFTSGIHGFWVLLPVPVAHAGQSNIYYKKESYRPLSF